MVEGLYLMMGRALEWLPAAPAGNVVAIGGLAGAVLKSGTLASTPAAPALAPVEHQAEAIVQACSKAKRTGRSGFPHGPASAAGVNSCVIVAVVVPRVCYNPAGIMRENGYFRF